MSKLVKGSEIEEGTTMVFLGSLHRVAEIKPYVPTPGLPEGFMPEGTRSARWEGMTSGMTIEPDDYYEVAT